MGHLAHDRLVEEALQIRRKRELDRIFIHRIKCLEADGGLGIVVLVAVSRVVVFNVRVQSVLRRRSLRTALIGSINWQH